MSVTVDDAIAQLPSLLPLLPLMQQREMKESDFQAYKKRSLHEKEAATLVRMASLPSFEANKIAAYLKEVAAHAAKSEPEWTWQGGGSGRRQKSHKRTKRTRTKGGKKSRRRLRNATL